MVFIAYILTRIFVNSPKIYLEGDEARHLKTARDFYRMWNNQFYDFHPYLYSLLIKIFKSGVVVSLLSSLGLFWVTSLLYQKIGLTSFQTQIALTFISFNYLLIWYSNRIFRYQLFVLLFTSTLLVLYTKHWIWAGILGGLSSLTCGFNGLKLLPIYFLFHWLPIIIHSFIYTTFWLIPKFVVYRKFIFYPCGPEGKLDRVYPISFKQLISPMYSPYNFAYYGKEGFKKDFKGVPKKLLSLIIPMKWLN